MYKNNIKHRFVIDQLEMIQSSTLYYFSYLTVSAVKLGSIKRYIYNLRWLKLAFFPKFE